MIRQTVYYKAENALTLFQHAFEVFLAEILCGTRLQQTVFPKAFLAVIVVACRRQLALSTSKFSILSSFLCSFLREIVFRQPIKNLSTVAAVSCSFANKL
jgi:hypothetical protein